MKNVPSKQSFVRCSRQLVKYLWIRHSYPKQQKWENWVVEDGDDGVEVGDPKASVVGVALCET